MTVTAVRQVWIHAKIMRLAKTGHSKPFVTALEAGPARLVKVKTRIHRNNWWLIELFYLLKASFLPKILGGAQIILVYAK